MKNPFRRFVNPVAAFAKRTGITVARGEVVVPDDITVEDASRAVLYGEPALRIALTTGKHITDEEYMDAGWFRNEVGMWAHPGGDEYGYRLLEMTPSARVEELRRIDRRARREYHAFTGDRREALSTADIVEPEITTVGNIATWVERKGQWVRDVFATIR
jgi:hypothetical protein